ncbi:MAG: hypothetical protein GKS00_03405 [Alphaproteobacteria bacterium]|nr:hypothetical protein [Alphaproteobacteria bacterium]
MRLFFLIAAPILFLTTICRADAFLAGLEDVPIMPGIEVVGDAGAAFDSPAGRIVEAYAAGDVTRKAVRDYYQTALPQLGWVRTGVLIFSRDGEKLTIELLGESAPVTVRFELAPVSKESAK